MMHELEEILKEAVLPKMLVVVLPVGCPSKR